MKETFSNNLKQFRKQRQLSQEQLAEHLGITTQAVSKWECSLSYPDIDLLPVLADFFHVSIDTLLREDAFSPDGTRNASMAEEAQASSGSRTDAASPFPDPGLPDDNVLRIVQYRGNRLIRKDTYDPNIRIPLSVSCDRSVITSVKNISISVEYNNPDVEVWGSADIFGDISGNLTAGGNVSCSGDISGNVTADGNVSCGSDISGNVTADGSVSCGGDVGGSVNAEGSVNCGGDVGGSVTAEGSVSCDGDVGGSVAAEGDIRCNGDISGDVQFRTGSVTCKGGIDGHVDTAGSVSCDGDIEGNVKAGGNVTCADVEGSVYAGNDANCADVSGDVTAGNSVTCYDISGDVKAGGNISKA